MIGQTRPIRALCAVPPLPPSVSFLGMLLLWTVTATCDRRLVKGLKGRTKQLAVLGCSKFGVSTVSDLLERDGTHVRTELRVGGGVDQPVL
jgi:hypothetical protein